MDTAILLLERYGLIVVFFNVMLTEIGLPLPAYPTLAMAAALTKAGGFDVTEIVLAGIGGSLVADLFWFWGGGHQGRRILRALCKLSMSPDSCVQQTETLFVRFGPWSLLFAKFLPGLNNITVALAGITKTPLPLFLLLDILGAAFFVGVPIGLGILFKDAIADILSTLADYGKAGGGLIATLLLLYFAVKWAQRQSFLRQLRMDRITVPELLDLIKAGEPPLILDVRSRETRESYGIIPGAKPAHASEMPIVMRDYPRHLEVVIYCSCPNEASAAMATRHLKKAGFKKIRPLLGGTEAWIASGQKLETMTFKTG
jgi:membrane protein DedA with SNARE-associated domain/rhodanese-related sulfurtransferase